jgi:transcriptional regulator with XRE-family HTH domain
VESALQRFGANVRQARLDRGWSQEDLSGKTKLATVQVSRIERGVREIRLTTLIRLLDGLEVPPDKLLDGLLGRGGETTADGGPPANPSR